MHTYSGVSKILPTHNESGCKNRPIASRPPSPPPPFIASEQKFVMRFKVQGLKVYQVQGLGFKV